MDETILCESYLRAREQYEATGAMQAAWEYARAEDYLLGLLSPAVPDKFLAVAFVALERALISTKHHRGGTRGQTEI